MSNHDEYISSLNGELSPEQAAQLLELADMGDTGTELPEESGAPSAALATEGSNAGSEAGREPSSAELEETYPEGAVILAKDNKHTIPYEKLAQAREGEKHWRAQAEAAQRQLEALQAQAQQRADAGEAPTKTDNQLAAAQAAIDAGIDPGIFGDFSEEALAKGIATLVAAQVQSEVSKALAPVKAKEADQVRQAHYDAIYAAHPDADSIAESKELAEWIASQPSFVRSAYEQVFQAGTTQDVIELFDRFKQATGATPQQGQASTPEALRAAAKAAIDKAPAAMPASLTDFPGGRPAGLSKAEALAGMDNGRDMLAAIEDMAPQQIEDLLNKLG